MTRVLLCYPRSWAQTPESRRDWVKKITQTWKKAHPEQTFEVVPTWDIPGVERESRWSDIMEGFHAVVAVESTTRGKHVLDSRASQFVRDGIIASKECWVFRSGMGMAQIADLKPAEEGRSHALIYRKNRRRKQP